MSEKVEKRSKRWWQLLKLAGGLSMIGWLAYYLLRHRERLATLFEASPATLLATALAVVVTWLLIGAQGWVMLRALEVEIGFVEHNDLQLASILANYLPVRLGPVLKMHYLGRVHQVPLAYFGSLMMVRAVMLVGACGVFGLAGVFALRFEGRSASFELIALFALLIAGTVFFALLPLGRLDFQRGGLERWRPLAQFVEGVDRLRAQPRLLALLMLLIILQLAVVSLRLFWTYGAVSTEASAAVVATVAAVAALVNLLAFTMGSLGLREAAIGWATEAVGFDFSRGVFAGLVDRAVLMTLAYVLGAWGLFATRRRLRRRQESEGKT